MVLKSYLLKYDVDFVLLKHSSEVPMNSSLSLNACLFVLQYFYFFQKIHSTELCLGNALN